MAKSTQKRINDTLNYIQNHIGNAERNEVSNALPAVGSRAYDQISQSISLGHHFFRNKDQRHARRALLLCHQVFINNVATRNQETQRAKRAHKNTSETELRQRIRSWFTEAGADAAQVCARATERRTSMPLWSNVSLDPRTLIRGVMPNREFNCYNAVVFWAFQGGTISLRWIWNHWYPAGTVPLQAAALLPGAVAPLPALGHGGEHHVPQARVVVMQRAGNPLGHTVMSIGNGLCISQNNKTVLPNAANAEPTHAKRTHARSAINACNQQRCHEISIRFLAQEYYPPPVYTPGHHPPFWLSYAANER